MTFILVLAAIFIVGAVWYNLSEDYMPLFPGMMMSMSGLLLVIALIGIPIERMTKMASVHRFHSIQATADRARESGDGLEGAAFRMEIAEANAWLASAQYWRTTQFSIYVPEAIDDLEPIQ
jgi:hypothetical protein